jgi:hypothetical protein
MIEIAFVHAVMAFCPDITTETTYGGAFQDINFVWAVEDSPNWTIVVPGLTTTPGLLNYKNVISTMIDKSSQEWSRLARSRTRIGFGNWYIGDTPGVEVDFTVGDGRSQIVANNGCPVGASYSASFGPSFGECDIRVCADAGGGVIDGLTNSANGEDNNFDRILTHEMGHCHGIGHPNGCYTGNNCAATPQVTQGSAMAVEGCGRRTDLPHPDDGDAHSYAAEGLVNSIQRRATILSTSFFPSAGFRANGVDIDPGFVSAFPARIDCQLGSSANINSPDCVVARTYRSDEIRLTRLAFPTAAPTTVTVSTTPFALNSRRATDVAVNTLGTVAAAIVSTVAYNGTSASVTNGAGQTYLLPQTETLLTGPVVVSMNNATGGIIGSTPIFPDNMANENFSTFEPRVTFALDVPSTCITAPCEAGAFIAAVVKPNRSFLLFKGAQSDGQGTYSALTLTYDPGVSPPVIDGSFDFHCPKHVPANGGAERRTCRLYFTPASADTAGTGLLRQCSVRIDAAGTTARFMACSTNATESVLGTVVASLVDYGTGQPASQRAGRHWLLGTSARFPHLAPANALQSRFVNPANGGILATANENRVRGMDAAICTAVTAPGGVADLPRSYFGEISEAYCTKCDRIIEMRWGNFSTEAVGWETRCK